ncbi:ABC transporter permease [Candidatus Mycoplasma haematominutum]|uniref:ABC transporter, permease n=1 Tax=Candidatus Mycoplasma haematominutum 'Birmingham 1' TaxID=1116213 RepID=G8C3M2_9MOLU|nr:ABC transporter permease [Candidatus Mycoplasma haematominutum]CCE66920.1 ABC transporter, permease [Candidatus Mycoplasma haematominutum 'Birmingham 1']
MLLISKTVVNHVRNNLFSTSVITFFAGCSAFIQISSDNIREIVDASVKPYTKMPRQDMFIKTGKKDIYSGGSSFTVPVKVEVEDSDAKESESSTITTTSTQTPKKTKLRYATPMGFFVSFDNQLGKDRLKKVGQEAADYGKDYCIPKKGIKSIYTNYWFRPKVRFKGPWDAETEGKEKIIPKDNDTYRSECSDYTEIRKMLDQNFIAGFMYDYINQWHKDETQKTKGLVTFMGADDAKFIVRSHESHSQSDGVRVSRSSETNEILTAKDRSGSWSTKGFTKYSWIEPIWWSIRREVAGEKWEKCGRHETNGAVRRCLLRDFIKVGQLVGINTRGDGFSELTGRKYEEYTGREYINKYRERKKARLKVELEEWLLNSRHLDIRKLLQDYRDSLGQSNTQISQVSQVSSSTVQTNNNDLWEPITNAPWIKEILKRKVQQDVDGEKVKELYKKYRQLQENQLLRRKVDPNERKKLKFNIHNSVQVSNTTTPSSQGQGSSSAGHSFKVISIESEQDRGNVNPLVILRGNPLFEAREDQEQMLNDFINAYDLPFYAPWMVPMLRMISRAKFPIQEADASASSATPAAGSTPAAAEEKKDEKKEEQKQSIVRETLQWWVDYLQYPWRDRWNIPAIKAKQFDPEMYDKLQLWLNDIHDRNWNRVGSRIIFSFEADNRFYPLSKQLSTSIYIPIGDVKLVGYIEQPTSFFTVISPEYAKIHNLEPISDQKYKEFRKLVNNLWLSQEDWEKAYDDFTKNDSNKKHYVEIGNRKMIIVGIGQTPDLVFPMQSWLTVQPDKYREALVYVDKYGFNDLKDRGTVKFQEQYITIRVPEEVKEKGRDAELAYMNGLKTYLDGKLGEDKNYYLLTKLGEEEGSDQIYSVRSSYVPTFQSRIGAVSYVLTSAVYAVVLLLLLILIKKYAQSNMYLFGNFIANGVVKADILINICLFAFIPLVAATTIGYLLSLGLQSTFYSIISSYWYLGVKFSTLGATNALYFIFKVLAFVVPMAYFCSLWTLKDNVSVLLKTTLSMKVNYLTILFYKIMYKITTMWKFRSVLIFNTLNQSGILSMCSVVGFIFLNFFLHNHGKFAKVGRAEQISKEHEYEFDLESPTKESGEYNLATYADLGRTFDDSTSQAATNGGGTNGGSSTAQLPKGIFAVNKGTITDRYYQSFERENKILDSVLGQYTGNFEGWWGDGKAGKCAQQTGKPEGVDEKSSGSKVWACLGSIGVLEKDNSSWSVYKPSQTRRKKRETSEEAKTYEHYHTKEPIFKFWSEHPKFKDQSSSSGGGSGGSTPSTLGKSYSVASKNYFLPSLSTLLKMHDNYWIISSRDYDIIGNALDFFKTKTILRILLDLNIEYKSDVGRFSYNVWDLTSKNLERAQPILQKMDEQNYDQFIQDIVRSKYGPFFVARFMTEHDAAKGKQKEELKKLLERQGGAYQGKKTFMLEGEKIGREEQETNKRNGSSDGKTAEPSTKLKSNGNGDGKNGDDKFKDGLYYLDGSKVMMVNSSSENEKELILVYHPEFLYLMLTVLADFASQKGKYTLPMKYTFGNIVHTEEEQSDTTSQTSDDSQPPKHYYSTIAGPQQASSRRRRSTDQTVSFDPSKTPKGDQTYTWTAGPLQRGSSSLANEIKIIGLKEDARGAFYKLYKDGKLINSQLYKTENIQQVSEQSSKEYPIIINKYAAKYYGLKIGDTIQYTPNNHLTRFTCKLLNGNSSTSNGETQNGASVCQKNGAGYKNTQIKAHTLKVVDIFDSYYKDAFFMAQKDVNEIIGLNPDTGFNGIFTPKREGKIPAQISTALSSYSVSGIYTNVQQNMGNYAFRKLMKSIPPFKTAKEKSHTDTKAKRNYHVYSEEIGKGAINYSTYTSSSSSSSSSSSGSPTAAEDEKAEDEAQKFISNQFLNAFREYVDPMASVLKTIANHSIAGDVVFKNLGDLTNNVSYLFIFIVFPILLVSLITIVHLLVKDLETVFVTMKLLGFGNKENSAPLIVYLFTLLFVSTFIGSLVVPYVLDKYVNTLFTSQSILLPLSLDGGLMTAVFSVFAVIYLFSMFRSFVKVKGINLPMSVKLLVG